MADMNSSLLGFLKKKSLFAYSPDKNKPTRQLSRDNRNNAHQRSHKIIPFNPQRSYQYNNEQTYAKNYGTLQKNYSTHNMHKNNFENVQSEIVHSMGIENARQYQQNPTQQQRYHTNKKNYQQNQQKRKDKNRFQEQEEQKIKNIWTANIMKVTSFQSARIQSIQCLDNMGIKLQTEISSINYKIDAFRNKMVQVLDQQFGNLRDRINYVVDKIISQSQKNIKMYIREQENVLAADLISTREILIKQYQKVQNMKEDINKPNWRKVAGQLLSSQLQEKVDQIIHKSKSLNIKNWEVKNLGAEKMAALQRQLRNVVNLGYT